MGPRATADLYMAIVALFQQQYGARYDADFPQMIINSVPAPDVVERLEDEARLVETIRAAACTGEPGDGVISVANVNRLVKIRTAAESTEAL